MKTEKQPSKEQWIDQLNTFQALSVSLQNQAEAISAIHLILKDIEKAIDKIFINLKKSKSSRLIYVGAGTSARIGVQDGVELFPKFGWPKSRVSFLVAGGLGALTQAVEGAEDDVQYAKEIIKSIELKSDDIILGISASGNTPFTLKIMKEANNLNILTIGITNNKSQKIKDVCDIELVLDTGSEIVAGSTRLKAGTAQKICLNLISTICMSKLGFVKKGLMNNLVANNKKLIIRKEEINKILNL